MSSSSSGENRSFDHVFATYQAKNGEQVFNLLSQGIVTKDGKPGPNFYKAEQHAAADPAADSFLLAPAKSSFPNNHLPAPLVGGPKDSYVTGNSLSLAMTSENGLPDDYYPYPRQRRHRPDLEDARHPHLGCERFAARPLSVDQRHHVHLQLLRGQPRASFLPDVAAARLRGRTHHAGTAVRLRRKPVLLGRDHGRGRHQRPRTSGDLQHRVLADGDDHRRRLHLAGLLQCAARRRAVFQESRRQLCDERQLSPVRQRRDRRESHHAGSRRHDLVQRRQGPFNDAAAQGRGRRRHP